MTIEEMYERFDRRFTGIEQRLTGIEQRLKSVEQKQTLQGNRLGAVEHKIDILLQQATDINDALNTLHEELLPHSHDEDGLIISGAA